MVQSCGCLERHREVHRGAEKADEIHGYGKCIMRHSAGTDLGPAATAGNRAYEVRRIRVERYLDVSLQCRRYGLDQLADVGF
jgi:hypothetical protein